MRIQTAEGDRYVAIRSPRRESSPRLGDGGAPDWEARAAVAPGAKAAADAATPSNSVSDGRSARSRPSRFGRLRIGCRRSAQVILALLNFRAPSCPLWRERFRRQGRQDPAEKRQSAMALIRSETAAIHTPNRATPRNSRKVRIMVRVCPAADAGAANHRLPLAKRGQHETLHCRRFGGGLCCFV